VLTLQVRVAAVQPGKCLLVLANGLQVPPLQHYLGHKNITHTVRYTELAPDRFKTFWRD